MHRDDVSFVSGSRIPMGHYIRNASIKFAIVVRADYMKRKYIQVIYSVSYCKYNEEYTILHYKASNGKDL